jgi:hypothetical protein
MIYVAEKIFSSLGKQTKEEIETTDEKLILSGKITLSHRVWRKNYEL